MAFPFFPCPEIFWKYFLWLSCPDVLNHTMHVTAVDKLSPKQYFLHSFVFFTLSWKIFTHAVILEWLTNMRYDSDTQSMTISKAIHIWSVLFPAPAHSSQVSSSSWISGRQSPTKESSPVSCALSCFNLEQLTPCSCNAIMYIRWRAWSPNVGQKKCFTPTVGRLWIACAALPVCQ